ncbi:ABC transporter permease [Nocardioides bruguierae]|uniref:Xylose transport system permease protein XylH n=1 Tax=Nocardioides bruguierae TaxID=2945102 RepID=A0A9X2IH71_9ACTN|nr:ABC transporter permease [Nocardioides bruguierae]MCM0622299.1 ABC transporter permease [Nocardioides bruguierae]
MSAAPGAPTAPEPALDERVASRGVLDRLARRPELGALLGALAVLVLFTAVDTTGSFLSLSGVARWTDSAASIGIVAVFVALLMIGGEFDLSAGVMVGSTGLVMGMLVTQVNLSIWPAIVLTFVFAAGVGALNGWLVVTTRLPSFIVTLAMFFSLQGINLGLTKLVTGTVRVSGLGQATGFDSASAVFAGTFGGGYQFRMSLVWWLLFTVLATWVLTRVRFGSWVQAVGGDQVAARNVGVPVTSTKITLFMGTSMAAAFVGVTTALRLESVQAGQGVGEEFTFIIAAVVGGCLLTGGFGSAVGASIGASIIGMAFIGIAYAGWNTDWSFLFLGLILFLAVMVNTLISRRVAGGTK